MFVYYEEYAWDDKRGDDVQASEWKTSWQVAVTYIGTVVGAGFASGQEILQFFTRYGSWALLAIVFTTALFYVLGRYVMRMGRRFGAHTFGDVCAEVFTPGTRQIVRASLLILVFGVTVAMVAGSGALLAEQLRISFAVGALVSVLVTGLTLIVGMRGLVSANAMIVPTLLLVVTATFIALLSHGDLATVRFAAPVPDDVPIWRIGFAMATYVGFNIGLSLTVLIPLGQVASSERALTRGALLGALGLGVLLVVMHIMLASRYADVQQWEVPLGALTQFLPFALRTLFILAMWAEIYSTLLANVFGMATELSGGSRRRYATLIVVILSLSFVLCQIGFSKIVTYGYPVFGYVGLFLLAVLMVSERRVLRL